MLPLLLVFWGFNISLCLKLKNCHGIVRLSCGDIAGQEDVSALGQYDCHGGHVAVGFTVGVGVAHVIGSLGVAGHLSPQATR